MSVSNPMTILFWLGIYGSILVKTAADEGSGNLFLYSVAVIAGVVIWDLFMVRVFRRYLSNRALSWSPFYPESR